jgi:high frequency lysogenization protein
VSELQQERVLALAGIFQGARLAQQLSREGRADPGALRASFNSVLMIDAESAAEVYGGVRGLALGLNLLREKLAGATSPLDLEMARYAMGVIQLEGALKRRPEVAEAIRAGLRTVESQMAFFEAEENGTVHPRLVEKLAELYLHTLSTLTPRIMVNGDQGFLSNPYVAASVRTALFAGVRSAVLWRQVGGSRWQLLLQRGRIVAEAGRLLERPGE